MLYKSSGLENNKLRINYYWVIGFPENFQTNDPERFLLVVSHGDSETHEHLMTVSCLLQQEGRAAETLGAKHKVD